MTTIDCRFETREKLIKRDAFDEGFEDGVKTERVNTEREKKRADKLEKEVEELKKKLESIQS